MGKLKINFLSKGENVEHSNFHKYRGYIQRYQRQYHTSTLNKIEFDGEDYEINLDVEHLENGIDFSSYEYPTLELKGKVLELLYYKDSESNFKDIIKSIEASNYSDRYDIKRLGQKALTLMESTRDSDIFPELQFDRERYIGDLKHTLNSEVDILVNYTKSSSSKKSQNESVQSAVKHLLSDIRFFMIPFDNLIIKDASKN